MSLERRTLTELERGEPLLLRNRKKKGMGMKESKSSTKMTPLGPEKKQTYQWGAP